MLNPREAGHAVHGVLRGHGGGRGLFAEEVRGEEHVCGADEVPTPPDAWQEGVLLDGVT